MSERDRPYSGQPHTFYGERGARLVSGLTLRDICDCYVKGILLASGGEHSAKVEAGTWDRNDLYGFDLDLIDPGAAQQNMCCEIEKMMGIYPNVPRLRLDEPKEGGKC